MQWKARWLAPVSMASLVVFRILFGLLMFIAMVRFFAYGWIEELYAKPTFFFSYDGFSWVRPWPLWGLYVHFAVVAGAALCIAVGYRYRLSVLVFFCSFTYIELLDKTNYLNHYYLVSLLSFLMLWMPLHRSFSLDAWKRPDWRCTHVPAWVVWAFRIQVGSVYFFAGVAKIKWDWLFYAEPLSTWLTARTSFPGIGWVFAIAWVPWVASWAAMLFDLTVPFWLSWQRSRPFAYGAIVLFHTMTYVLFFLGMFPWLMTLFATIFFAPDWPQRCFQWFRFRRKGRTHLSLSTDVMGARVMVSEPQANAAKDVEDLSLANSISRMPMKETSSSPASSVEKGAFGAEEAFPQVSVVPFSSRTRAWLWGMLGVFFLLQGLLPFRHHLYGGNVSWHEQGFRFAWHVMLTEKSGYVEFRVRDVKTKRVWRVFPHQYLTPLQANAMSTRPDMILQLAHEIARRFGKRYHTRVEVYADVFVALNGRKRQRLIDPKVDLAAQPRGWSPKTWILPCRDLRWK